MVVPDTGWRTRHALPSVNSATFKRDPIWIACPDSRNRVRTGVVLLAQHGRPTVCSADRHVAGGLRRHPLLRWVHAGQSFSILRR